MRDPENGYVVNSLISHPYACLFVWFDSLRPINNLQLNRDGSSWVEPVLSEDKCVLLKDHNAVTLVRLELVASRSRVKHSTTEPLGSLRPYAITQYIYKNKTIEYMKRNRKL